MYHSQLEAVISFAGGERFKKELLEAKATYFAATGEIFEDDRSFEMRMASFLDFFVFDYSLPKEGRTPAQLFCEESRDKISEAELEIFQGFTKTMHSLYEVRKIAVELVRLRDLFTNKDVDVYERRQPAGLQKGDLIESRLIPVNEQYLFSQAFCFHPVEVKKSIVKRIKQLKKEQANYSAQAFIWALSKMRLKFERYRNVAVNDIYSFDMPEKKTT